VIPQRGEVVAVEVEAMVVGEAEVAVETHVAKMGLQVARTKATSSVSSAIRVDTMPTGVQKQRSTRRHIMLVQMKARILKLSCLQRLNLLFQMARGRRCICRREG
jgi:hypothetical protein